MAQQFTLTLFGQIDYFSLMKYRPMVTSSDSALAAAALSQYRSLCDKGDRPLMQYTQAQTLIMQFIHDAKLCREDEKDSHFHFILKMLDIIHNHLTDPDVLIRAMAVSSYGRDYTAAIFKKHIGRRPKQYVLEMRLRHGKNLLQQGYAVKTAAVMAGFTDELYFSRYFRKTEKMTPTEYKTAHQH